MLGTDCSLNKKQNLLSLNAIVSLGFALHISSLQGHWDNEGHIKREAQQLKYKTAWIQAPLEASPGRTTISFTLPFTPDINPVFKWSLTNTEHLMEFAASNWSMFFFLRLYFGRQEGKGSQRSQATDITVGVFFEFPNKNKTKRANTGGIWANWNINRQITSWKYIICLGFLRLFI